MDCFQQLIYCKFPQQQLDYSSFLASLSLLPLILFLLVVLIYPVRILSLISLPINKKTSEIFLFYFALT